MTAKLRRDRCAIENAFVHVRSYSAPRHVFGKMIFKPGAAWFLEIVFVKTSVCVCVYVRPQAIKSYSREMKPE